jgi:hypothetical protein
MKKISNFLIVIALAFGLMAPASAAAQSSVSYPNRGGTGTSTIPTFGQVLVGQTNGTYGPTATSSLKLNTSDLVEGSNLFHTDARVWFSIMSSTTIRDYLNWWAKNTSGDISFDRKVGIGVTEPAAELVVNGMTNTQVLTVASTTATSTFNGNVKINGNLELSGLAFFTVVSSGNMSVGGNLSVTGTTEARGKVYNSTGALTIDQNGQSNGAIILNPTSGNIGIGDTNPGSKLSVTGNSALTGNLTVTGSSNLAAISGTVLTATGVTATNSTTTNATSTNMAITSRITFPGSGVWTSAGNVGIGTTTPDGKLTVYKTGSGSSSVGLTVHDAVNPTYATNADNLLTVRGTGSSASTWRGRITAGGDNRSFLMGEYNSQAWLGAHTANLSAWADLYINPDGTTQSLYVGDTGGVGGSPTPILTVSNALGNVGIGTTTPAAKLAVVGDVLASYFSATSTTATSTFAGGFDVGNGAIKYNWASGATTIQNLELGNMSFDSDSGIVTWVDMPVTAASSAGTKQSYTAGINGNPLLTVYAESDGAGGIQNSGVGIGTSTPLAKLDIWGNFRVSTSTSASTPLVFADTGTGMFGLGTSSPTAQLHTTGTVRFSNFGSGSLQTDASGNVSVSSDERLKDIEGSFSRGLADIVRINPILYKWNATSGLDMVDLYAGFSAQNIEIAIPEAVGVSPNGYLSLSDRPILATAVNAIKELNMNLASTTERIASAEQRIVSLEATLASIGSGSQTTIVNATTSASSTVEAVSSWLSSLGIAIENAVARFATVIADVVTTKKLTVGDSSNLAAAGITIFDRATGAPVCMFVENGVMKSEPGECGVVEVPEPAQAPAPTPDPEPIPDPAPAVEEPLDETGGDAGTTTPDQVPAEEGGSEPAPEVIPDPEPTPEPAPEPSPEPAPEPESAPVATE